jgi:hypothetical protein
MRIFCSKWFARFARHERISRESLRNAIERAERGLIDADLGGGLIKQRIPRQGKGRSSGYRVIVAFKMRDLSVFLYGFAKNELENIEADDLTTLRELASEWLAADTERITLAIAQNELQEVFSDD